MVVVKDMKNTEQMWIVRISTTIYNYWSHRETVAILHNDPTTTGSIRVSFVVVRFRCEIYVKQDRGKGRRHFLQVWGAARLSPV